MEKKNSFGKVLRKVLAWVLAIIICIALVAVVVPMTERVDKTNAPDSTSWMSRLPDNAKLNELILPGTHDSATQYVQLAFFSKCQALSIGEQLNAGFRYLDIRLGADGEQLKLMHGFTNCKQSTFGKTLYLDSVLSDCYDFLKANPTETIIFAVKQEHGDEPVMNFQGLLNRYIQDNPDAWLLTDTIPTVGEARGKIVLMRRYADEAELGKAAGIPLLWEDQNGTEETLHAAEKDNGSYTLWVQDRFEYGRDAKWEAFCDTVTTDANTAYIDFLSTKGGLKFGHPYHYANQLNKLLKAFDSSDLSGWVVVDFGSSELASHIYGANFK